MGNLGAPELLIIAVVVVLLFGSKKLPEMARSLGRSAKILKAETSGQPHQEASAASAVDASQVARLQQQVDDLQQQLRAAQQAPKTTT
ncbi:Sec-independent protein translocase subunit TatA [Lentzea kentuckyensis]|uniref:Sec-independent protein translocase subunit TatA n=1 Tax=Lentzea kentuckyensis TaxID=360086 RepID=UPI000A3C2467|nr:Sec-independent protein translocase subunit TatA [Lentzea kentuckyensis]